MTDRARSPHSSEVDDVAAPPLARAERAASLEVGEVYRLYGDYVFRVLRRMGVPEPQVEDAVQDVFMVVLRRAHTFVGHSSVRTWVFGIALRVARAHRRGAARKHDEVAETELRASGPGPAEQAEHAEDVRLLMRLLDGLSEEQREVFVLSEVEGLTAPEMADALGVNVNTVYSRLRLARERFQAGYRRHLVKKEHSR